MSPAGRWPLGAITLAAWLVCSGGAQAEPPVPSEPLGAFRAPALPGEAPAATLTRLRTWVYAVDAWQGHSRRPEWRALMGWQPPLFTWLTFGTEALERAPGRYPHPDGRTDPAADFRASLLQAQLDPDFSCRFPLRASYLRRQGLVPAPTRFEAGGCADFEAWAQPDTVAAIELVFASPSWAEPATTAGHLLFRLRPRAVPGAPGLPAERVFSYGVHRPRPPEPGPEPGPDDAGDAAEVPEPGGIWAGLTGGLRGELLVEHQRDLARRYGLAERRDLYAYTLRLSAEERRLLLAYFWRQHRTHNEAPYAFFSSNCARLADDALRAVLPDLPPRRGWFFHPHEVITRALAAERAAPAGVTWSRHTLARRAEVAGQQLAQDPAFARAAAALAPALASDPDGPLEPAPSLSTIDPAAAADPEALGRLTTALDTAPALDPAALAALARWADAQLDLALYAADLQAPRDAFDESATTPALDAALALRARLPAEQRPRLDAPPHAALPHGGSQRTLVGLGTGTGLRPTLRLRAGLIDEQPGEARAVALRRAARFEFLVTEWRLRWSEADRPEWAETRFTLLATAEHGRHVRATEGPWGSRLNPLVDLGIGRMPAEGVILGGWARLGLGLHLLGFDAADPELPVGGAIVDTGFWSAGVDARIESWHAEGEALSATAGLHTELALPSPGAAHHLRLQGRAGAGHALDGPRLRFEATARLDLRLSARLGLQLVPYGRLLRGQVAANGWESGLALGW